ncbi:MAG: phosphodiester glycosidase family protein [Clostridia bacterium]|nr:phosphodiester glycosidase family protein [Clostridia bacterium]
MKRFLCLVLCFLLLPVYVPAEETDVSSVLPFAEYTFTGTSVKRKYDSDTLIYRVEKFKMGGVVCYLTKVWMRDPGQQIVKETAEWQKNIQLPGVMAKRIPDAALVINGSGYVSPTYPWIPENYPGTNEDYYYTPLGSLTVTNGELYRRLEGVPFTGLTLEKDGLHMYIGADNNDVLAAEPSQTWSFYDGCPMVLDGKDILPDEWDFADKAARRTVIGKVDNNNYIILSVTNEGGTGLTLRKCNWFLTERLSLEWAYDLDGGPSSALLCRNRGKKTFKLMFGGKAKDADVMGFRELP